jgi:hypothetical protein
VQIKAVRRARLDLDGTSKKPERIQSCRAQQEDSHHLDILSTIQKNVFKIR